MILRSAFSRSSTLQFGILLKAGCKLALAFKFVPEKTIEGFSFLTENSFIGEKSVLFTQRLFAVRVVISLNKSPLLFSVKPEQIYHEKLSHILKYFQETLLSNAKGLNAGVAKMKLLQKARNQQSSETLNCDRKDIRTLNVFEVSSLEAFPR